MPAEAMQPTPVVQVLQKPLDVSTVSYQNVMVQTVRTGKRLAGVAARKSGACACAADPCSAREFRRHRQQRVPHAPRGFDLGLDLIRHSLGVEVDQTPSRNSKPIVDATARPGDGAGVLLEPARN